MNDAARRINALAKLLGSRRYLEIGVYQGQTLFDVEIAGRTAVDPGFAFDMAERANDSIRFVEKTSDDFFLSEPVSSAYDLIFVDGLHVFEQVVRDFSNALLHAHPQTVLIIDDTVPNDVYSAIPDPNKTHAFRKAQGNDCGWWHGDVFKLVFYIHDFWPGLNYRTIVGSGNQQTLVWRSKDFPRQPRFNNLERISRLSFFDLQDNFDVIRPLEEDEAISLCVSQILSVENEQF
jgi:hypothetical protein